MSINQLKQGFRLITSIFGLLRRRQSYGTFMKIYSESKFDAGFIRSYSQIAEDLVLMFYLKDEVNKTYIDVGCNDPNRFSNTRLLYEAGWTGIDIDANLDFAISYLRSRPKNLFINALIGTSLQPIEFYRFAESALNTTSASLAGEYIRDGWELLCTEERTPQSLSSVIIENLNGSAPTLLCLDCEGADFDVLKSADLQRFKSKWIMFESHYYADGKRDASVTGYLQSLGYTITCTLPQSILMRYLE